MFPLEVEIESLIISSKNCNLKTEENQNYSIKSNTIHFISTYPYDRSLIRILCTENIHHGDNERSDEVKSLFLSDRDIHSIKLWLSRMKTPKNVKIKRKEKGIRAESILQLKYDMIGSGSHRIVYDLQNDYVLKIVISRKGFLIMKMNIPYTITVLLI